MKKIRIVIVDDSAMVRKILREALASDPEMEIVGIAPDGESALTRIEQTTPDVVTLGRTAGNGRTRNAAGDPQTMAASAMTNVVDVYINYLRRKVETGYDRPLIRTVRGTGYQIGTNGYAS